MRVPQGRAAPLKRRLHRIVALAAEAMFLLLPRKYGGSSLSRSDVLVADVGRGLIQQLKQRAYWKLASTAFVTQMQKVNSKSQRMYSL